MARSRQRVDDAELAALADDTARESYFAARPELIDAELAWRLAEESGRSLRVDLERAGALAATARWLAERLEDPGASARSLRAEANVLQYRRRYERAAHVYGEAIAAFDRLGDKWQAAITRSSAIGSLSHLGRYDQASEFADSARGALEEQGDRLRLGRLEVNAGHILARQDRFPEAMEHYRRARELFTELGRPIDLTHTVRNIAVCYQDLNDFHAARAAYREARDLCREHGQTLLGLEVEYNIAYLHFLRGEYTRAIRLFERARDSSIAAGDRHHEALCDLDLAELFLELNLARDAEHLAAKASVAFDELGMEYESAKALACRALAAARTGRRSRALELLARAQQRFGHQENRVWCAMVDLYRAQTLFAESRLDDAARRAEAALEGFADSEVPSRIALCELLLARIALARGNLELARRRVSTALTRARKIGRPQLEVQAHLIAGQIDEATGDSRQALARYAQAHRAVERLRGQLPTDELKIAFGDDKQALYEGLVAVSLREDLTAAELEAAFGWVETAKARGLADLLAFGSPGVAPRSAADEPLVEELEEVRGELRWHHLQLDAAELVGGEAGRRRRLTLLRESRQRERRLLDVLRRLRSADAELSSLQESAPTDLAGLRSVLAEDCCLLEYFIARGVLYAFTLARGELQVQALGEIAPIRELHHHLQSRLAKYGLGPEYRERFGDLFRGQVMTLLERLHAALLGSWQRPPGVRHLLVVPHRFLHQLPFHALYDGQRFLIDELDVSYAPSATVFRLCAARSVDCEDRSLVLGVTDARAPQILDEARAVAAVLPGSTLLVGAEATVESLSRLGDGCRFVHLATHGLHRRENPMFSAIQLGNGRLSLLDLYDVELGVELAVLSGCGTGLGDVRGSDELVGLTRGLLFAGARSVLATLWDVHDESTAELMRLFYGRLTADLRPAAALRQAMLALRETHPHPYYWAPFVVTGQG